MRKLFRGEQCDSVGRDALLATSEAEMFGGCCFDADIVGGNRHGFCKCGLHGWDMRIEFGPLCTDCGIDIADFISFLTHQLNGFPQ